MTNISKNDWIAYEGGEIGVRCPQHRGWTILQNPQEDPELGIIHGSISCATPGCGFSDDVELAERTPDPEPEGGTLQISVGEEVTVHNDGLV